MTLAAKDQIALEARIGADHLWAFVQMAWPWIQGEPLDWNWHLKLLCDHYEACLNGEISSLVANIPPGCSKSSITNIFFPAWAWIKKPGLRWLFASCDQTLVNRDARLFQALISSKHFQARWGDRVSLPGRVQAIEELHNNALGVRLGTTPGGKAIGWHFHFQMFDDLIKPADLSTINLATVEAWRSETMSTRWLPAPALNCRIMIAQRLHEDDPPQHELDDGAIHVNLPMQFDPDTRCETKWGKDPRTTEGELLDPKRFPLEKVLKLRQTLGPLMASAQLDQRPAPKGGAIFRIDHFDRRWKTLPARLSSAVISVDCAFKDLLTSDYVVVQLWARSGPDFILIDQLREQAGFSRTCELILALRARWNRPCAIIVEDKANGAAVVEALTKTIPGVLSVNPLGGKESRANAVQPFFESKNVVVPDEPWVTLDLIPEFLKFPRGRKDDQVDAATQALSYLHQHYAPWSGLAKALGQ